jgi:predicted nucleotidyltransferase component of viral defense system
LVEVQAHFELPSPILVEKDWHVVKALAAIAAADTGRFKLVFGGGTALSRAHKITRRMSEDVDLRIIFEGKRPSRGELRALRKSITTALLAAGFKFDPKNEDHVTAKHEGTYTKYSLPYDPIATGSGLRPHIQIEMSVWPLRRPSVELPVSSFVAEAKGQRPELPKTACASVLETAAEKLSALTWRAGSEFAGLRKERDSTLVRHIYDLHMTRDQYKAEDVAALAADVIKVDAVERGDKFPAWKEKPLHVAIETIAKIGTDKEFADNYAKFLADMVYGDKPSFKTAIASLAALADDLKKHI